LEYIECEDKIDEWKEGRNKNDGMREEERKVREEQKRDEGRQER
jgi:hypothetical protein